jgi:hypothetical protein
MVIAYNFIYNHGNIDVYVKFVLLKVKVPLVFLGT